MKKIIGTYGVAVIAMLVMSGVFICIMAVFFGGEGKGSAIAFLANESISGTSSTQESGNAFMQYRERKAPEIIYLEDYEVRSGEYVPVKNCFTARNLEGDPLTVEISYILNIHEEPEEIQYIDGEACFYFELHGVYKVFVQATDQKNNTTYAMVKLPVNKGGFH